MYEQDILKLYQADGSTRSVAKMLGISQGKVSQVVKKHNVSRSKSDARKLAKEQGRVSYDNVADNLPIVPWNAGKTGLQVSNRKGMHFIQIQGDKHWNWQGGKSREQHIRYSLKGKQWTRNILKRDDYTCQVCNTRGGYLHSHHILPFAKYEECRCDKENGITLCKRCHRLVHKIILRLEKREELLGSPLTDRIATTQLERANVIAKKAFDTRGQSAADPTWEGGQVQRPADKSRTDGNSATSIPQLVFATN